MDDVERDLLTTLKDGRKVFHVGRCPVRALHVGWALCAKGHARIDGGFIEITDEGRTALEAASPPDPA